MAKAKAKAETTPGGKFKGKAMKSEEKPLTKAAGRQTGFLAAVFPL